MSINVVDFSVSLDTPIHDVIVCIDRSAHISIALIVDEQGHLINTITDGDVRRGILAGIGLEKPVKKLLPIKALTPRPTALTALAGTPVSDLLRLMQEHKVRQIPLLNKTGKVVDIVTLNDISPQQIPLQAMVMAGGQGTRLRPLTDNIPKPMLDVGGRPIIELIIERLSQTGIHNISISTNYQSNKIKEHFGDGSTFGIELNYIDEDRSLGTAGALGLMDKPTSPVLVINGDILTQVNFEAMLSFHQELNADLTIGVRQYFMQVQYGVVECDGSVVKQLQEKPSVEFLINAGIYLLKPSVYHYIPRNEYMDMTDLIQKLLDDGRPVSSFPIMEYWLDIGQPDDYKRAQDDISTKKYKNNPGLE